MEKSPRPAQLEASIREISRELLELTITPHVRELRAKAVTYTRVIANWAVYAPTPPQIQAMVECISELETKVAEAKRGGDREVSKVARRPVSGTELGRSMGSGSLLPSAIPPSMGWTASVPESSGVRARKSLQPSALKREPASGSDAPTRPPPANSGSPPATNPPVSAPRVVESDTGRPGRLRTADEHEHPTPVPELLRSRRMR